MNKYISYKILADKSLIIEYLYGRILPEELKKYKEHLSKDPLFNPNFNILVDSQDSLPNNVFMKNTNFKSDEKFKQLIPKGGKLAVITRFPNQVVEATLFQDSIGEANMEVGIFSSIKPACRFLELKLEEDDLIINHLEELKTSPINRFYID